MTGSGWLLQADTQMEFSDELALVAWLQEKAGQYNFLFLLGHAVDGVIWDGFAPGARLTLAGQVFPEYSARLHPNSLQELRLFSQSGELHLWKSEEKFSFRVINEPASAEIPGEYYDEDYLLWGTAQQTSGSFTMMQDGANGMNHAIPLPITRGNRAVLKVRHYISYDEPGQALVSMSRLCGIEPSKE
jgi:CRISPR-associated protein (TIGR03984 family)